MLKLVYKNCYILFLVTVYICSAGLSKDCLDDVAAVWRVSEFGWRAVYYGHMTAFYPIMNVTAFGGHQALGAAAFMSAAIFCYYAVKLYGRLCGTISVSVFMVLTGRVFMPWSSTYLGSAGFMHWYFLFTGMLFITKQSKPPAALLGAFTLLSGLPVILIPCYLLFGKKYIKPIMCLAAGFLVHCLIKQYIPYDWEGTGMSESRHLLARSVSFDIPTWLLAMTTQGVLRMFGDPDTVRLASSVMVSVGMQHGIYTWVVWGGGGAGWVLLSALCGWRMLISVLVISMLCFAGSMANIKWHTALYPDHGHYQAWIGPWLALCLTLKICNLCSLTRRMKTNECKS